MTHRERILTVLSRKPADRVPMDLGGFNREAYRLFIERTGSQDPWEYFGVDADWSGVGFAGSKDEIDHRQFHRNLPEDTPLNEWGTAFIQGSNAAYDHFVAPLTYVTTVKEIQDYPLYDVTPAYRHEHLEESVRKLHDENYFVVGNVGHMGWEKACYMRGILNICQDLVINQDFVTYLLDKLCDYFCFMSHRFSEAGVDMIWLSEDLGMQNKLMISPEMYRKWIKPRTKKAIDAARKVNPNVHIAQHHCGYVKPLIGDFLEIGVNALHPIQPESMDPVRIKRKFSNVLSLWGTVGAQSVIPFGTPDDVRRTVRENIKNLDYNGGYWIAPSQVLIPEVPWENVAAFFDAVEEFGSL